MEDTLKILVVDDDEVDRMAVRRALRASGISLELVEVRDCASAIAKLQEQPFDCVFLDYWLPDGDGLSLVQTIQEAGFQSALVVLTGQGDEEIAVQLMKAGASDYLSKAKVSPESLSRSLRNAIRIHRAEIEAAQANQKLRENEERFRSLVQNSSDIITILEADGTARYVSPSIERILGYRPEEVVGNPVFQYVCPEDLPQMQTAFGNTLKQAGIAIPIEIRVLHQDGAWVYLEVVANNLLHDPSVRGVVVNARNISERKRSEQEQARLLQQLETERGRLEAVLRQMPAGVIIAEAPSGKLVLGNEQVEQIWRHPFVASTSVEEYRPYRGFHANGQPYATEEWPLARSISSGEVVQDEEIYVLRGDDTWGTMRVSSSPIRDRSGQIVAGAVIFYDVTERQRAEAQLQQRFEQLQTVYQMADAVSRVSAIEDIYQVALNSFQQALKADRASVLLFDADGVMRFKAWRGLSDHYRRSLSGHSPWTRDTVNPEPILIADVATELANDPFYQTILAEGIRALGFIPLTYKGQLLGKFMIYYEAPHSFTDEEVQLAQTIANHVAFAAERKRAEEELRVSETRFRTMIEQSPLSIQIFSADGTSLQANRAWEQLWSLSQDLLNGYNILEDRHLVAQELMAYLQQGFAGEAIVTPPILYSPSQADQESPRRWIQAFIYPLKDEVGTIREVSLILQDITERKQAEEAQRFLAEASTLLASSLDYQTTFENLARYAVPHLADWCTVDIAGEEQSLRRVAIAHTNPEKIQWAKELQQRYPPDPNASYGAAHVLRTGRSEFYPTISDELLVTVAHDSDHLELLRQVGFRSAMVVPLLARGRTLGVITFVAAESGRNYTPSDLALAEDLAHRAALAADNARLYREAQEVGENLRQAILILGEQQQQLRTLQRLTNLLNQRLADLPGLLQTMVRAVCDSIPGAEFGLIALSNAQRKQLELTAKAGLGMEKLKLDESSYIHSQCLGQVFLTGESLLVQRHNSDCQIPAEMPASMYAVAIESAQAGRLGVLAIGNWEDNAAFDEEEQRLLTAFGEQAAIAINNAQLINALEEREERLAVQNDILARQNLELERQRQQIQLQNLQLLEAAQMKSQFLATMSHELRTPMNAIIGFSQLLLRQHQQKFTGQQIDMLDRILNNGKNLLALINDILDLSRIEVGRLELRPEEINLANLVFATTEELRSLADQKNLKLEARSRLSNAYIVNDSLRLRQVLVNLLSNAIKFTEVGSVEIEVWECADDWIAIAVRDTGIGIAQDDLKHIFEEFRQVDQSLSKKYGGTGLGLAITDWLVRMMNGKIIVESKLGEGSTFRVEMPRLLSLSS